MTGRPPTCVQTALGLFIDRSGGELSCWPWTQTTFRNGYGRLSVRGRSLLAHRVTYEFYIGAIPHGLSLLHSCDNPICCNPAHLRPGTPADNMQDKVNRGRALGAHRGSQHHNAVLTETDVVEMRKLHEAGVTQRAIALQFGVSFRRVNSVVLRRTWKHV